MKNGKDLLSRRNFVKTTAVAATAASTFTIVNAESVRGSRANSMVEIGWVGNGGQGTRDAELLEVTGKAKIVGVADYFQDPERKLNPHAVFMGVTMMANTVNGFTFTTEQFAGWLADAGFVEPRLLEPIGFQQCMIATKGPET